MSETTGFGPNRMREIIRFLCLLAGAPATAWCIVTPTEVLEKRYDAIEPTEED